VGRPLISADSHVVEPPDLWTARLPARFRERAPRQLRLPDGDAWQIEGVPAPFPFGLTQCGGLPPEQYRLWIRWEEVRPEAVDPAARLAAMDASGVEAELLFPSPRIQNAIAALEDRAFEAALVAAYNDWLSEWCAKDPRRLLGVRMLPAGGIGPAVAELERTQQRPGLRGVLLSRWPAGGFDLGPADDPLFARCAEAGEAVHLHVGLSGSPSQTPAKAHAFTGAFTGAFRFYDPPVRIAEMIYTQLFDRFPALEVVCAEVDVGWVPYLMEQLDDRYARQNPASKRPLALPPSGYFSRNLSYTIVKDRFGIRNRHAVGVDRILWSSDFPHATCDFPDYAPAIAADFAGVPDAERDAILSGNARRLYFGAGRGR
jgi:predicted TIM-barrel fold metal-dependent hydrolase